MAFFDVLQEQTTDARNQLFTAPIFERAFTGNITREMYIEFLTQAYHHVKHTVPLLMTVGGRLPEEKEWLRTAVAEYIDEEVGHQEWILNDIEACGGDKEVVRNGAPDFHTELMVAYAYDMAQRVNPLGFFGMVHVLEGTSITSADKAAEAIQQTCDLPNKAFSYLRSHGALDLEHVKFFEELMNRISDPEEQELIISSAKRFYYLYGNIFRSLTGEQMPCSL
ncbi:TenA family transcriptional regulator [Methylophaga sp.]|uniref:TenA family transcriptional regulator n=1 Tax=Methylophaga sp. TaxID=2024840 RepID=UPI003F6A1768